MVAAKNCGRQTFVFLRLTRFNNSGKDFFFAATRFQPNRHNRNRKPDDSCFANQFRKKFRRLCGKQPFPIVPSVKQKCKPNGAAGNWQLIPGWTLRFQLPGGRPDRQSACWRGTARFGAATLFGDRPANRRNCELVHFKMDVAGSETDDHVDRINYPEPTPLMRGAVISCRLTAASAL